MAAVQPTTGEDHMRVRFVAALSLTALAGCSWLSDQQKSSVYFQPYSAKLDPQAIETVHTAANFARAHPLQPVTILGFSAPPDPQRDVDGLSAQRAETVKQALVSDGIGPQRITTSANGVVDPKTLPSVAVRRVDINVGQ
jgi:outer membrane protein OmpA-like peptidoglycan-associated protein